MIALGLGHRSSAKTSPTDRDAKPSESMGVQSMGWKVTID